MADGSPAWPEVKLGDIGKSLIGLTFSPENIKPTGTLVLRSSNIQGGRLAFEDVVYVDSRIPEKIKIRENDILICVRNGSRRLIGKSVILDRRVVGQTFGAFMAVYRSDANPYVRFFFESGDFKRQIDEHLGATINQITNGSLNSFVIALPPKDERNAIASRLEDVDQLILAIQNLITKKERMKQGMTQLLLTGSRRLPGFTSEWQQVKLGNAGATYGGLVGKDKNDFGVGSARFVTFTEVMASVRLHGRSLHPVRVRPGERQNQVQRGDVLFNGSSETPEEIALAAVVDYDTSPGTYLNSFCFGYRCKGSNLIDATFLALFFRSGEGRKMVASLAQGATRYNIAKTKMLELQPALPPIEEQRAIVDVLRDAESELQALHKGLAKARGVKTGMMQQLLSGRTRMPVVAV